MKFRGVHGGGEVKHLSARCSPCFSIVDYCVWFFSDLRSSHTRSHIRRRTTVMDIMCRRLIDLY